MTARAFAMPGFLLAFALITPTKAFALIGGSPNASVNMTQGLIANSGFESETAAVPLDAPAGTTFGHAVAYNSPDTAFISGSGENTLDCAGLSYAAFSYDLDPTSQEFLTGTVHDGLRFPTPSGISVLAGDPQIVAIENSTSWTVYVSNLAISNAQWASAEPVNNCLPFGSVPTPDEICVLAAEIPKNGSAPSLLPSLGGCAGSASDYDGTALTTDGVNINVASWEQTGVFGEVHMWHNGTQTSANPFPNQNISAHAIFVKNSFGIPIVIAPDVNGNFWVNIYGNQWSDALEIAAPNNESVQPEIPLAGQPFPLREIGYDAVAYGTPYVSETLWLFTRSGRARGKSVCRA
jgi:hypothetical protein